MEASISCFTSDGVHLIFGFVELEAVFELTLPFGVGGEGVSLGRPARSVKLQQFIGHVLHGLLYSRLGLLPLLRAEAVEYRLHAFGLAVLLHQIQSRQRYIKPCAFGILQDHELGRTTVFLRNLLQPLILADAMFHVDDVVADGEMAEVGEERADLGFLLLWTPERNF